jgi:hypothetical protein
MSNFIGIIAGGLEIVAGIAGFLLIPGFGVGLANFLIYSGAGMLLSGVGTLVADAVGGAASTSSSSGIASASRNPIAPWLIPYGRCCVGGTIVYINSFGDTDQYLDLVMVIAACQIESFDGLLFDKKRVQLSTSGGTFTGIGDSFSPLQQTLNIVSITRVNGVVTCTMDAAIPLMQPGDIQLIQGITGAPSLNGRFPVESTASGNTVFTYIAGGTNTTVTSEGTVTTTWPDYGKKIHCEVLLGDQTSTFSGLLSGTANDGDVTDVVIPPPANAAWNSTCVLKGKACVFLRLHYDQKTFSGGIPQISFLIHGRNQILDTRTNTVGYTENAALCIADYLNNATWGFRAAYYTQIPAAQLNAAANVCDEAVTLAAGGTEPRYACNGKFDLSVKRGQVLQALLTSCAGRLTYQGGIFAIWPGAWYGASPDAAPGQANMTGPIRWRPTVSRRDLYNGVKGTYICPANNWQSSDIPPYAQDSTHGYSTGALWASATAYVTGQIVVDSGVDYIALSNNTNKQPHTNLTIWETVYQDVNLNFDGGDRRWLDVQLAFTISPSTAQRILKIELLRRRWWGTGTFRYNMRGYKMTTMDVITETVAFMGWSAKQFEILAHRLTFDKQESDGSTAVTLLGTEVDVQETDSSIYDWSDTEELTPQGYQQPAFPDPTKPAPPTDLTLESDSSTVILTPAGIADSIVVSWDAPADGFVLQGGRIEVQYQELENNTTGTVQVTAGSTAVVGTGTAFSSQMEGGTITADNVTQAIASVTDATHLTLSVVWAGSNDATAAFIVSFADAWIGLPSVNASVTQVSINGVIDGNQYFVQARSVSAGGAPSDWVTAGPIIAAGARVPLPYRSADSPWLVDDALFPGEATFRTYTSPGQISLFGAPTINELSTLTGVPGVPLQATVSGLGGIDAGEYDAVVVAIDANGAKSAGSHRVSVVCLAGSSQFEIPGVAFDSNAVSWELYFGPKGSRNLLKIAYDTSANPPATDGVPPLAGIGLPDELTAGYRVILTALRHGGVFGTGASAIATHAITVPFATTASKWAGRVLSLYGSAKAIESGGIGSAIYDGLCYAQPANFNITDNDAAGVMTVTQSTLLSGSPFTFAGDAYVMRAQANIASSNTIGDSLFVNEFAPGGLATDAEKGKVVLIVKGLGKGQMRKIASNTSDTLTIEGIWAITPDATSIFVILESSSQTVDCVPYLSDGTSINVASLAVIQALFPDAGTQSFLVQIVSRDASGNLSAIDDAPWQEVFVPQTQTGAAEVSTTPYNIQATDLVLTFVAGASVANLPPSTAIGRRTLWLVNKSGGTVTLNAATASGDTVDSGSSLTLSDGSSRQIIPNL